MILNSFKHFSGPKYKTLGISYHMNHMTTLFWTKMAVILNKNERTITMSVHPVKFSRTVLNVSENSIHRTDFGRFGYHPRHIFMWIQSRLPVTITQLQIFIGIYRIEFPGLYIIKISISNWIKNSLWSTGYSFNPFSPSTIFRRRLRRGHGHRFWHKFGHGVRTGHALEHGLRLVKHFNFVHGFGCV